MGLLQGAIGLSDLDNPYLSTIGQSIVYDAGQRILDQYNADIMSAVTIFVQDTTEDFKIRYRLPGNGELQLRQEQTATQAVKAGGSWDVAFPLQDWGARLMSDDITLAYMTANEFNLHLETVMNLDANLYGNQMLKALFNNTPRSFLDPIKGSLSIQPLANTDGTLYPPVIGSTAEAEAQHYLASGYVSSAISNTNNPFATIVSLLEARFGAEQGGASIVAFINPAQTPLVSALAAFVPVPDRYVVVGDNTATLQGYPRIPSQARIVGRVSGAWVAEWRRIPADYILAIHSDAPAPLMERVDPAFTGIARGLHMQAKNSEYPLESSHYVHRFGFGIGNRLSAAIMQLTAGSYSVPAAFVF